MPKTFFIELEKNTKVYMEQEENRIAKATPNKQTNKKAKQEASQYWVSRKLE